MQRGSKNISHTLPNIYVDGAQYSQCVTCPVKKCSDGNCALNNIQNPTTNSSYVICKRRIGHDQRTDVGNIKCGYTPLNRYLLEKIPRPEVSDVNEIRPDAATESNPTSDQSIESNIASIPHAGSNATNAQDMGINFSRKFFMIIQYRGSNCLTGQSERSNTNTEIVKSGLRGAQDMVPEQTKSQLESSNIELSDEEPSYCDISHSEDAEPLENNLGLGENRRIVQNTTPRNENATHLNDSSDIQNHHKETNASRNGSHAFRNHTDLPPNGIGGSQKDDIPHKCINDYFCNIQNCPQNDNNTHHQDPIDATDYSVQYIGSCSEIIEDRTGNSYLMNDLVEVASDDDRSETIINSLEDSIKPSDAGKAVEQTVENYQNHQEQGTSMLQTVNAKNSGKKEENCSLDKTQNREVRNLLNDPIAKASFEAYFAAEKTSGSIAERVKYSGRRGHMRFKILNASANKKCIIVPVNKTASGSAFKNFHETSFRYRKASRNKYKKYLYASTAMPNFGPILQDTSRKLLLLKRCKKSYYVKGNQKTCSDSQLASSSSNANVNQNASSSSQFTWNAQTESTNTSQASSSIKKKSSQLFENNTSPYESKDQTSQISPLEHTPNLRNNVKPSSTTRNKKQPRNPYLSKLHCVTCHCVTKPKNNQLKHRKNKIIAPVRQRFKFHKVQSMRQRKNYGLQRSSVFSQNRSPIHVPALNSDQSTNLVLQLPTIESVSDPISSLISPLTQRPATVVQASTLPISPMSQRLTSQPLLSSSNSEKNLIVNSRLTQKSRMSQPLSGTTPRSEVPSLVSHSIDEPEHQILLNHETITNSAPTDISDPFESRLSKTIKGKLQAHASHHTNSNKRKLNDEPEHQILLNHETITNSAPSDTSDPFASRLSKTSSGIKAHTSHHTNSSKRNKSSMSHLKSQSNQALEKPVIPSESHADGPSSNKRFFKSRSQAQIAINKPLLYRKESQGATSKPPKASKIYEFNPEDDCSGTQPSLDPKSIPEVEVIYQSGHAGEYPNDINIPAEAENVRSLTVQMSDKNGATAKYQEQQWMDENFEYRYESYRHDENDADESDNASNQLSGKRKEPSVLNQITSTMKERFNCKEDGIRLSRKCSTETPQATKKQKLDDDNIKQDFQRKTKTSTATNQKNLGDQRFLNVEYVTSTNREYELVSPPPSVTKTNNTANDHNRFVIFDSKTKKMIVSRVCQPGNCASFSTTSTNESIFVNTDNDSGVMRTFRLNIEESLAPTVESEVNSSASTCVIQTSTSNRATGKKTTATKRKYTPRQKGSTTSKGGKSKKGQIQDSSAQTEPISLIEIAHACNNVSGMRELMNQREVYVNQQRRNAQNFEHHNNTGHQGKCHNHRHNCCGIISNITSLPDGNINHARPNQSMLPPFNEIRNPHSSMQCYNDLNQQAASTSTNSVPSNAALSDPLRMLSYIPANHGNPQQIPPNPVLLQQNNPLAQNPSYSLQQNCQTLQNRFPQNSNYQPPQMMNDSWSPSYHMAVNALRENSRPLPYRSSLAQRPNVSLQNILYQTQNMHANPALQITGTANPSVLPEANQVSGFPSGQSLQFSVVPSMVTDNLRYQQLPLVMSSMAHQPQTSLDALNEQRQQMSSLRAMQSQRQRLDGSWLNNGQAIVLPYSIYQPNEEIQLQSVIFNGLSPSGFIGQPDCNM